MTRYNNLVKQASKTPTHEPTDDEIITNSSINLHPTQAQDTETQDPLHLPTVSQAITRLLNESKGNPDPTRRSPLHARNDSRLTTHHRG